MTKRLMVGDVAVGGGAPVSIQSMCNTKTDDVRATVEQIHALEAAGCEIIRIAIPDQAAAESVDRIKEQISIPRISTSTTSMPWRAQSGASTPSASIPATLAGRRR